jgi:polar amino acid transport system permease protein
MILSTNQILFLFQGVLWTLVLSAFGFVGGGMLGMALALMRISRIMVLRTLSSGYIQLVQGVPLPVMMFMCYFGLALTGYDIPALIAAALCMTLFSAAYLGEIWRASIKAVPRTQWEASDSLALTPMQKMWDVILPQAVRLSIPPTVGFLVQIIKNTSYAVVIGFVELTQSGRIVNNTIFEPFLIYTLVGALYFALCFPLSSLSRRLEAHLRARGA